jgi:hypothetical protein
MHLIQSTQSISALSDKENKIVLAKGSDLLDPQTQDELIDKVLNDLFGPEDQTARS